MSASKIGVAPAGAFVTRDTTIAEVLRDLNRHALRIARWAGPASSPGYAAGFLLTGRPSFAAATLIALAIGIASHLNLRAGRHDAQPVLVAGGVIAASMWPVSSGTVRGGLSAALVVLAMVGFLILPARERSVTGAFFAALILGQLLWPLLGMAEAAETMVHTALALAYLAGGLVSMDVARRTMETSERTRLDMFRRVPIGLFRISRAGRLVEVNPAFGEMLGTDPSELIGRSVAALYEDPVPLLQLASRLGNTAESHEYEHRLVRRDGTPIWVRGHVRPVVGEFGSIEAYEGAVEDVTLRREIEERSRIHAERFRNVFERAPIAIWEEDWTGVAERLEELRALGVADLRSYLYAEPEEFIRLYELVRYIDVNPAGMTLVAASTKQEAFENTRPDPPPSPIAASFIEEFTAIWEGQDHMTLEAKGNRVDRMPVDLTISWAAARDQDGRLDLSHVIVAMVDITAVKRAENELADLVASKDELVASVSHELRTPITTIMGMAFELRDHGGAFSPGESGELISLIADQSRELSNIVEDLLVAARSDLETLAVRPERLVVRDEVEQIIASSATELDPAIEVADGAFAWADALRFRQIIRNLLSNARRYGGRSVRIEAVVDDDAVVVTVFDDGPGVPPGDEESIFLPYVRSAPDDALPGSIGLGLPVSRRLARLMGGELTYRYDGGSVFELRLPTSDRQETVAV